jgi:hypothetical protein
MEGEVSEFVRDERLRIPNGITADRDGNLYVVSLGNTKVLSITPQGEIAEVATLPGTANGHVAYAGRALYVTQIWENVVLRVEMDGSYQVVAGDGTLRLQEGGPQESRVPFPNGITASPSGDVVYFNTLEGNMVTGHTGIIRVHKLYLPSADRAFETAWGEGGMEGLRAKFDAAQLLEEATADQLYPALYGVGRYFLSRGNIKAGLAMIEWTAEIDEDEVRRGSQLGRAHLIHGEQNVATHNLERALDLAPDNESLKRILESAKTYRRNQR